MIDQSEVSGMSMLLVSRDAHWGRVFSRGVFVLVDDRIVAALRPGDQVAVPVDPGVRVFRIERQAPRWHVSVAPGETASVHLGRQPWSTATRPFDRWDVFFSRPEAVVHDASAYPPLAQRRRRLLVGNIAFVVFALTCAISVVAQYVGFDHIALTMLWFLTYFALIAGMWYSSYGTMLGVWQLGQGIRDDERQPPDRPSAQAFR